MGQSFTNSNVHIQLAKPQIYIPLKAASAHAKPGTEIPPLHLEQCAAQQMLTASRPRPTPTISSPSQLSKMACGGGYSKISAATTATPSNHVAEHQA